MSLPFCSADFKNAVGSQRQSGQKQNKYDKLREKDIEIHGKIKRIYDFQGVKLLMII